MRPSDRQRSGSTSPGNVPLTGSAPERGRISTAATDPTRTCVGCRGRAGRGDLLRVVAVPVDGGYVVRPDPRRRLPGRGAWLHLGPSCLEQAQRRRAFGRALRVAGLVDVAELAGFIEASMQDQAFDGPTWPDDTT